MPAVRPGGRKGGCWRDGVCPWATASNPFWRYGRLQGGALALAFGLGGWVGLVLFLVQALVAVWQLELTNYVEHYGLTRCTWAAASTSM